jgi:hypothetical protein
VVSSGKQIDAILLDFSKAFDKVPHRRLLMKLDHYGIRGTTLKWIQDFLIGRTQQVLLDSGQVSLVVFYVEPCQRLSKSQGGWHLFVFH